MSESHNRDQSHERRYTYGEYLKVFSRPQKSDARAEGGSDEDDPTVAGREIAKAIISSLKSDK